MRELDELRNRIEKRFEDGEITEEVKDHGLKLIRDVEAYLF